MLAARILPPDPRSGSSTETLLLALLASASTAVQVKFCSTELAWLLGWWPQATLHRFRRLEEEGWVRALEGDPDQYQMHSRVIPWVWARASFEMPTVVPSSFQDAAQSLLILRVHG